MSCITNLKNGIEIKPTSIEAIAPSTEYPRQKSDIMTAGQKVAAIPDHPKIANQKIVRLGETIATVNAMASDNNARPKVTQREI